MTAHRRELERTAEYLLEYENMDAKTFELVFAGEDPLPPPGEDGPGRDAGPELLPEVTGTASRRKDDRPKGEVPH